MICNREFMFLHIPKTGGVSSCDYLCQMLAPPVYYFGRKYRFTDTYLNARVVEGWGHETLEEIYSQEDRISGQIGQPLSEFKKIAAVIRHPYELEISSYHFFKQGKKNELRYVMNEPGVAERVELAQSGFGPFLQNWGYFRNDTLHGKPLHTEDYFLLNGQIPENLVLIRFETLEEDLPSLVAPYSIPGVAKFPHRNRSKHQFSAGELTEAEKSFIQEKHSWLFEQGYYLP